MAVALLLTTPFIPKKEEAPPSSSIFQRLFFQGKRRPGAGGGGSPLRWTCRKEDIHPEFYEDAKVYCNGELVLTTGGTQQEYTVDVWSGNHPFYLGNRSALLADDDQVEKFRRKYGQLSQLMEIPVLKYGEIILPSRKKSGGAGKGKGKK